MGEGFEVVERVGSETAPKSEVGAGFLFGKRAFGFEGSDRENGRGRVQGHVEEGGAAAGGEGAGASGEAFPIGATGFVEVDMGIDPAWEEEAVGVIDFDRGGAGEVFGDGLDEAIGDAEGDRGAVRMTRTKDEIEIAHAVKDLRKWVRIWMPVSMSSGEAYSSG